MEADSEQKGEQVDSRQERRERAYRSGAHIARERMKAEAPHHAEALRAVEGSDVIVVRGVYDRVEQVLDALQMPYTVVTPEQLARLSLRPEQLLVVNCPGDLGADALRPLERFVAAGGSLFTTDWALKHVIEPVFPGVLAYNQQPTADDVVRIEIRAHDNPFLAGVMDEADDPQWWLEGSSYPIHIVDPSRVEVLITSKELETKYGEAPVAVLFRHDQGEVFHMISHYYLQRTELRSKRHSFSSVEFARQKGVDLPEDILAASSDLDLGEVESAHSSARLFANVVAAKKLKHGRRPSKKETK